MDIEKEEEKKRNETICLNATMDTIIDFDVHCPSMLTF